MKVTLLIDGVELNKLQNTEILTEYLGFVRKIVSWHSVVLKNINGIWPAFYVDDEPRCLKIIQAVNKAYTTKGKIVRGEITYIIFNHVIDKIKCEVKLEFESKIIPIDASSLKITKIDVIRKSKMIKRWLGCRNVSSVVKE